MTPKSFTHAKAASGTKLKSQEISSFIRRYSSSAKTRYSRKPSRIPDTRLTAAVSSVSIAMIRARCIFPMPRT